MSHGIRVMKTLVYGFLGLMILALFTGTTWFLYQKSQKPPVVHKTTSPVVADIEQVTVASGTIMPRKEIEIKPQVPGILEKIYVEPGDTVKAGTVVAKIRQQPHKLFGMQLQNFLGKNE